MPKATKKAAPAKKTVTKAIKKEAKPSKKEVGTKKPAKTSKDCKLLELGLLLDCTSSMGSWIERAKTTLQ